MTREGKLHTITMSPKLIFLNKWKPRLKYRFRSQEFDNDIFDLVSWFFDRAWAECERCNEESKEEQP